MRKGEMVSLSSNQNQEMSMKMNEEYKNKRPNRLITDLEKRQEEIMLNNLPWKKRLNKFLLEHKSLEVDELEEKIKSLETQLEIEMDRISSHGFRLSQQYKDLENQIYVLNKLIQERLDLGWF